MVRDTVSAGALGERFRWLAGRGTVRLMPEQRWGNDDEAGAPGRGEAQEASSAQDAAGISVAEDSKSTSRQELLERVLDEELPRFGEALCRLGE